MCIVLLTTAHPRYALIVIDNRDEFILRPTSRPHWWTTVASRQSSPRPPNGQPQEGAEEIQHVLSSRDLQRAERGTWLGITRSGHFAVLTNYRETDTSDAAHPVHGTRSRGGMVTAWLGSPRDESVADFVRRMMADNGCRGVGGFSLICGKLRRRHLAAATNGSAGGGGGGGGEVRGGEEAGLEPLAILSNRNEDPSQVPWICGTRGEVYGLSNTSYDDPATWPKLEAGKQLLQDAIREAAERDLGEDELRSRLFGILDTDTLPIPEGASFDECIAILKHSIFIPPIGDEEHKAAMAETTATTRPGGEAPAAQPTAGPKSEALKEVRGEERPDEQPMGFMTGMYGTQRQTVVLVDWEGNVTYTERALWDGHGKPIARGEGDVTFRFKVEGWEGS